MGSGASSAARKTIFEQIHVEDDGRIKANNVDNRKNNDNGQEGNGNIQTEM